MSLPVRKRQRTEEQLGEAVAFAPSQVGEARADRSAPHRSRSPSSGESALARHGHLTLSKAAGIATQAASGPSPLAPRTSANFIKADLTAKLSVVWDIFKSWDLATPGTSDPSKVTEEEVAMAEVFARGVKAVAECRRLKGLVLRYQWRYERLQVDLDACETEKKRFPSPKRTGRRIIPVGVTSCPLKPRIGFTEGTMSRPGRASFLKQSQVMMST